MLLHIVNNHRTTCVCFHSSLLFRVVKSAPLRVAIELPCHRVNTVRLDENVFDPHGSLHHGNPGLHISAVGGSCSHFANRVIKVGRVNHPPIRGSPVNFVYSVVHSVPNAYGHRPV